MTWWLISMATAFQPATSWQHLDDTHLSRNYPLSSMGGYIYLQPDRYGLLRFESSLRMAGTPIPSIGKEACLNGRVVANHTTPSILCCDATNILTWDTREYAAEDSLLWSAVDVDNDGFDDLIGYEALHLYRDDGYHSVPYPPPHRRRPGQHRTPHRRPHGRWARRPPSLLLHGRRVHGLLLQLPCRDHCPPPRRR